MCCRSPALKARWKRQRWEEFDLLPLPRKFSRNLYIPCKFFNLLNADFQYLFFLIIFQRIFQSLDVDKNEKISKDEYVKSMAKVPKIDFKWV